MSGTLDYGSQQDASTIELHVEGDEWPDLGNINGDPDVSVSWQVSNLGGGIYQYQYTLVSPPGDLNGDGADELIDKAIIELASGLTQTDLSNIKAYALGDPVPGSDWGELDFGNLVPQAGEDWTGPIYGIKFDDMHTLNAESVVMQFDVAAAPTWGDFYGRCQGADPNETWNLGFTTADNEIDHVAVPTPEPGTILLGVLTACAAGFVRRRRKNEPAAE